MSDRSYKIDIFKPEDAVGVGQLFREVYGEGYPVKTVYNPERLTAAFEAADYIPVLARTPDNRIVGYTALYRAAPHKGLYEAGQTLVLPEYRRTPVAGLLFRHTIKIATTISGMEVLYCEAVCNHTHVQRAGVMFRHVETAIEIDLMPAGAYEKEQGGFGRVSTVDMFRTYVHKPHTVYIPDIYADYLRFIYNGLDDNRTLILSTEEVPPGRSTAIATQVFDFAGVGRIAVHDAGTDFEMVFETEEKDVLHKQCVIIQVWLKSSWPWIGVVVNSLRKKGYFFGGILPRWFGEDGLLMQKVQESANWEGINLHTERAKTILGFVIKDRQEVGG